MKHEMRHTLDELRQWQALPLGVKIRMTEQRIRYWVDEYGESGCYVSFSGGKDSTVLLDIVRNRMGYTDIPAVFVDTGLEYPEIREFVKTFDNVVWLKPQMNFKQVIEKYGYPFISKEVSGTVSGARKYLTKLIEKIMGDKQKAIESDRMIGYNEFADLIGVERRYSNKNNPEFQQLKKGDIPNFEELYKYCKANDIHMNVRTDILFGQLIHKENGVPTNEYSKQYDRSRYKFFLDAPFEISNMCCNVMKKDPIHRFARETGRMPITAQMAAESKLRTQHWLQNGCNSFDAKNPISNPMSFWTEQDVLRYIKENNIKICSVYGDIVADESDQLVGQMSLADYGLIDDERRLKTTGCSRTGCMFCGYGCHLKNRVKVVLNE